MAFMTTNYKDNESNDYSALPQGEYEMIINKAQEAATKNGKEKLQIDLVVRKDLDNVQGMEETNKKYHNRHVFHDNWKTDINGSYQYDTTKFQYILDAIGVPENLAINSVDELIEIITGKAVRVYVKQEFSSYSGKEENRVAPWGYKKTEYPLTSSTSFDRTTTSTLDISDDDLPF